MHKQANNEIGVLIVDDHAIVRKGIRALLATEPDIEVVGEAQNGQEAIQKTQALHPDVVLMDLVMPIMDGLEATKYIATHQPQTRILVLTSFAGTEQVLPAIKAGAVGYLLKDSGPQTLIRAIHQVYSGNASLHPSIARKLIQQISHPSEPQPKMSLTDREMSVLKLVAQGYDNYDIARQLNISETTVRTHISHILTKLELDNRIQATLYALRQGLASLEDSEIAFC